MLQLCEEDDDASSPLAAPKPEPNEQNLQVGDAMAHQEVGFFLMFILRIDFTSFVSQFVFSVFLYYCGP